MKQDASCSTCSVHTFRKLNIIVYTCVRSVEIECGWQVCSDPAWNPYTGTVKFLLSHSADVTCATLGLLSLLKKVHCQDEQGCCCMQCRDSIGRQESLLLTHDVDWVHCLLHPCNLWDRNLVQLPNDIVDLVLLRLLTCMDMAQRAW
jgi:hypothetical protein